MTTPNPYVELTSAYTGLPVAIHVDLVGEVRDVTLLRSLGKTNVRHKTQRRVNWEVHEEYGEVMRRILEARAGLVAIPAEPVKFMPAKEVRTVCGSAKP